MAKKLYVGNLPFSCNDADLNDLFAKHGNVSSARVITDRETGRSKGFGFVEMADDTAADNAVNALNGQDFNGRNLTVNEARPRENRDGGARRDGGRSSSRRGYDARA